MLNKFRVTNVKQNKKKKNQQNTTERIQLSAASSLKKKILKIKQSTDSPITKESTDWNAAKSNSDHQRVKLTEEPLNISVRLKVDWSVQRASRSWSEVVVKWVGRVSVKTCDESRCRSFCLPPLTPPCLTQALISCKWWKVTLTLPPPTPLLLCSLQTRWLIEWPLMCLYGRFSTDVFF